MPALSVAQQPANATAAPATAPRVRVFTTGGSFVIELDRGRALLTVEAFRLREKGF